MPSRDHVTIHPTADVSDEAAVRQMIAAVVDALGGLEFQEHAAA